MNGRLVQTLLDGGNVAAGVHTVQLSRTIAKGWYLVSLRAGEMKIDKGVYFGR